MKTNRQVFALRACAVAVQGAVLALALGQAARAADEEPSVQQLTTPTSTIEAGASVSTKDSYKFGEYNGLESSGIHAVGNIDLRGGGSYDSTDATRWRITGTDLGSQSRSLQMQYGEQGKFHLDFGIDELLRNKSSSYQTPYQGVGTTQLTLPSNWLAPMFQTGAAATAPLAATAGTYLWTLPNPGYSMLGLAATGYTSPIVANAAYICPYRSGSIQPGVSSNCTPNTVAGGSSTMYTTGYAQNAANAALLAQNLTDLNDFHSTDLSTKRQRADLGMGVDFSRIWDASFSVRREDKKGLKGLGVVNAAGTETGTVFPELIDTTTDQFNAALNFKGEKSFATIAYYGAIFTNHAKSMTIDNPMAMGLTPGTTTGATTTNAYSVASATISEEPDNTFNQLRVTGGYNFDGGVKLVGDAAIARNAQNDPFVLDPAMFSTPASYPYAAPTTFGALNNASYVPVGSANALVVTTNFDLKLTARPVKALNLAAAYKYDDRKNETPVNDYVWYDAGAKNYVGGGTSPLNGATIAGIPSSLPLYSGVNIVANRPYSKRIQQLDFDADYALAPGQAIKAGVEWQQTSRYCSGSWIDCSFADQETETTGRLEYRFHVGERVSGRLGADLASRKVDYNDNAWMALQPALGATNIPALVALGWSGSVLGFMQANGLSPYGLAIPTNVASSFTGNTLAIYKLLYGTGNGSLSDNYFASHNQTMNWSGLDVYNMASRDRTRLRGALDWQATDTFTVQVGADYRHDNYRDSTYGLKSADSWALNLDGDVAVSEDLSVSGYYSHEDQDQKTANNPGSNGSVNAVSSTGTAYTTATGATGTNSTVVGLCPSDVAVTGASNMGNAYQLYQNYVKIDACNQWQADMRDKTDTVGLAFHKKNLISPKFSLRGDVSYSRSVTSNTMTGGFYYSNPLAAYVAGVPAAYYINAASLPDVTTSTIRVRLTGDYKLSKTSMVRLSYQYANLRTNDYQYSTNLPANNSGSVMPTFEQAPDYVVQVVGLSYVYSFQ